MKSIPLLSLVAAMAFLPVASARDKNGAWKQAVQNAKSNKAQVQASRRHSGGARAQNQQRHFNRSAGVNRNFHARTGASYNSNISVRARGGRSAINRTRSFQSTRRVFTPSQPRVNSTAAAINARRSRSNVSRNGRTRNRDWSGNNNVGGNNRDWQNRNGNGQNRVWTGRRGGHHHHWTRRHRSRSWWLSNFTRFALFGGGYYYWDSGYWYPAYGYDPYFSTYAYDAPIYGYDNLEPGQVIANVQAALARRGYDPGPIDGDFGPATRDALLDFQQANGLPATGEIDEITLESLGLQ